MDKLQIFNYDGKDVRTVSIDGEPWWILKDVCTILGLSDTNKTAERLDPDELTRTKLVSGGQEREMYIINESGVYNVIIRSDKPEAKKFKRWVTHEVLPSIRKTGSYSAKGYPRKSTSAGEVASLLKPIERVMIAQRTPPEERAATIQMICEQFGIMLPENFVKPTPFPQMMFIGYIA